MAADGRLIPAGDKRNVYNAGNQMWHSDSSFKRVPALASLLAGVDRSVPNLFAFPAQSNFSGVKHPLELVDEAQQALFQTEHGLIGASDIARMKRMDLIEAEGALQKRVVVYWCSVAA